MSNFWKMKKTQSTIKRGPMRTCIACRQVRPKCELVRLVRTSRGLVDVDSTGKKAGRGAYLCQKLDCWQNGITTGRLEYTLRATITHDNQKQLIEQGKAIVGG